MRHVTHIVLHRPTAKCNAHPHFHRSVVNCQQKCQEIICTVSDQHIRWTTKPTLWLKSWNLDQFKVKIDFINIFRFCFCSPKLIVFWISHWIATMRVYRDLFSYRSGIYKHSAANRGEPSGFHSVRLVGWGEEHTSYSTTKYWVNLSHRSRYLNILLLLLPDLLNVF